VFDHAQRIAVSDEGCVLRAGLSERDVRWEDCTAAAKRNNRDQLPGFVHWASKEQSAKRDFTRFLY